ncbi:LuxR C-terminal-related transcriptional regulator [Corynebacterium mastitidis]|uniref:LuxR C-terminal-related transcriptional regulator n=1 Tax=Corynebacterium mastitidis TaxID=161890 RepID=A0ABU8P2B2_9CORY
MGELTRRETHVLRLMALGLNNQEIAEREVVSMATVKTHVRHILMKTCSRDRVQAVLFAYRHGVVSPQELLNHPQG